MSFRPAQKPEASHQLLYGRQTTVRPHVVPLTPLWLLLRATCACSSQPNARENEERRRRKVGWDEHPHAPEQLKAQRGARNGLMSSRALATKTAHPSASKDLTWTTLESGVFWAQTNFTKQHVALIV